MKCPYCGIDDGPVVRECRCPKQEKKRCPDCCGGGIIETDYGFHTCVTINTCKKCRGTGEINE